MDANYTVRSRIERRQHDILTAEEVRRQGFDRRGPVKTEEQMYNSFWDTSKNYLRRILGPH
jgi:hypothetical protein